MHLFNIETRNFISLPYLVSREQLAANTLSNANTENKM